MKALNWTSLVGLSLATLLAPKAAWSLEYKVTTSLSSSERTVIANFLETAKQTLPKTVQDSLKTVNVKFEKIPVDDVVGHASRFSSTITLKKDLIKDIAAGETGSRIVEGRTHKTAYREALATVLHETIHLYDLLNKHTPEEQAWIRKCNPQITSEKAEQAILDKLPPMCRYYRSMNTTFSGNPYYLMTAGFILDFNGMVERSPDPYELKNPRENLAVNMEYFLMDPQYKCRRPTMYRMLSQHFKHIPFENENCARELSYVVPANGPQPAQMMKIDPAKVYQVHYLLADKGEAMMSGWGHAMIRLVICAPNHELGPTCLTDLDSHVVLSYRAFVDSMAISSMDGLTGKYPSRLFIIPLHQVVEEYAKGELRALKSIPLKLSRKEIEDVVTRSVESHWSYNGKYYFVSNNCATESMNLIRSALFSPELLPIEVKSPIDLYASLVRAGRADDSVFKNQKEALRLSYYFDSFEERFKTAFAALKKNLRVKEEDFKAFFELSATQRAKYYSKLTKDTPEALQTGAWATILETAIQKRLQKRIMGDVQKIAFEELQAMEKRKVKKSEADGKKNVVDLANDYMELSKLFAKPALFLANEEGYGLPLNQEAINADTKIKTESDRASKIEDSAKQTVESLISKKDDAEMKAVAANMKALGDLIRSLYKPSSKL